MPTAKKATAKKKKAAAPAPALSSRSLVDRRTALESQIGTPAFHALPGAEQDLLIEERELLRAYLDLHRRSADLLGF